MNNGCFVLGVVCLVVTPCDAAPRVVAKSGQLSTGLVIVPFAVPVAVPVAVLQDPTVVYGYRALTPVVTSAPPLPQGEGRGEGNQEASSDRRDKPAGSPVAAILSRHCAECHTSGAAQGGREFFSIDGRLREKLPRQVILDAVMPHESSPARMPPANRARLSPDELRVLEAWAKPPRELEW